MTTRSYRYLFIIALSAFILAACGDDESPAELRVVQPYDRIDFDSNRSGLITPDTLERWLSGWLENSPESAEGDLVVLQVGLSDEALATAAASEGVRVYDVSEDIYVLMEPRNNGLFAAGQAPARGVRVDAFLRKYGIDPQKDLVVFVAGELTDDSLSLLSMGWLALRYWGLSEDLLAVLNGDVADLSPAVRADEPIEALYDGTDRIHVLPSTEFSLTLSIDDVRTWVKQRPQNVTLWDTRSLDAFEGRAVSVSPRETSCVEGEPFCTAIYSGRIAGAKHLQYSDFLDADSRIREPAELRALLSAKGIDRHATHYLYDGDGSLSAIVAFVLLAETGYSARWYPNSFVEWSALNASHPDPKLRRIAEDSPWRTDVSEYSEDIDAWAEFSHGVQPIVINSRVESADGVLQEDERYLTHPPALPVVNLDDPNCF